MSTQLIICLVIFILTVIGYCTKFFSLGTVSMLSLCAIALTGCLTPGETVAYFGNATVVMIGAMCVVAAGFNRTQFCRKLSDAIVRLTNGNSKLMFLGYVVLVTILSQMIQAPVVAFGIVAPLAVATAENMGISSSKISMPIGIAAVATCCTLPIGAGATIAAELNGYLESYGYLDFTVNQLDPMIGRLPMLIITVIYCAFLAPKLAPEQPLIPPIYDIKQQAQKEPLNPVAEWAGIIIFFADALALIFSTQLKVPTWEICLIGAVLMVLFGTLSAREAKLSRFLPVAPSPKNLNPFAPCPREIIKLYWSLSHNACKDDYFDTMGIEIIVLTSCQKPLKIAGFLTLLRKNTASDLAESRARSGAYCFLRARTTLISVNLLGFVILSGVSLNSHI